MRDSMSGLEYMRRVAAGDIEGAPMVRLLGMRMTEVEEGRVSITAEVRPEHENDGRRRRKRIGEAGAG